jgi:DNA-binding transcriptional regulator YiaG
MNQMPLITGTSYGAPANFVSSEQFSDGEGNNVWDIFNDLTSPRPAVGSSAIMDAMSSFCASSVLPYVMARVAEDTLISLEVPQALAEIRHSLSLSTVELSKIFNVSRRAIYDWVEGKNVVANNRQRIADVHAIAQKWEAKQLGRLGPLVREEVGGHSLLGLLSAADLDTAAIESLLQVITGKLTQVQANRRVPTAQELLKRHSMTPLSGQAYERNLKSSTPGR